MNMQDAIKAQAAALTRLSTETTALEGAGVALQEAEEAFARESTDARWTEVEAKQSAYRRAQLTRKGAQEAADAATAKVKKLEDDAAHAKKTDAAARATIPAFRATIAPHLEQLVALHVASAESLRAIKAALEQQNLDAATAEMEPMTMLQMRGYVLASLEMSDVPRELGAMLNRATQSDGQALEVIATLLGDATVSSAWSRGLSTDATARADIGRLLDGSLADAVRKFDRQRMETEQQGREAAAARDEAQRAKQAADRAGRHGPAAA